MPTLENADHDHDLDAVEGGEHTHVGDLGESLEMYLKTVYHLVNEKRVARVRDIAERRNVRMPSVTGALKRLAKEGLVEYEAREFVVLTPEGEELARSIIRRAEVLERFLREVLQLPADTAERDSCVLEHYVSSDTLDRIVAFTEFVEKHPTTATTIRGDFSQHLVKPVEA